MTKPYDWSYTTAYKGTVFHRPPSDTSPDNQDAARQEPDLSKLSLTESLFQRPTLPAPRTSTTANATTHAAQSPPRTQPLPAPSSSPPYATAQPSQSNPSTLPASRTFHPTPTPLPTHLLTLPDPILFFLTLDLYEDELADNGLALLHIKLRVMPARLLLLQRFFMRLDDVLFRVRDTRLYIEFATGKVVREYVEKEGGYELVKERLEGRSRRGGADVGEGMRDGGKVSEVLGEGAVGRESVVLL